VREISSTTLLIAYQKAKLWEEIHLGENNIPLMSTLHIYLEQLGVRRNNLGSNNIPTFTQPNYGNIVPMATTLTTHVILVKLVKINQIEVPSCQSQSSGREVNLAVEV